MKNNILCILILLLLTCGCKSKITPIKTENESILAYSSQATEQIIEIEKEPQKYIYKLYKDGNEIMQGDEIGFTYEYNIVEKVSSYYINEAESPFPKTNWDYLVHSIDSFDVIYDSTLDSNYNLYFPYDGSYQGIPNISMVTTPLGGGSKWKNKNYNLIPIKDKESEKAMFYKMDNLYNPIINTSFAYESIDIINRFYEGRIIIQNENEAYLINENGEILKTFSDVKSVVSMGTIFFEDDIIRPIPYINMDINLENTPDEYYSIPYYVITYQDDEKSLLDYKGNEVLRYNRDDRYEFFSFLENGNFIAQIRTDNLGELDYNDEDKKEYIYKFYDKLGNEIGESYKNVYLTTTECILIQKQNNKFVYVDMDNNQLWNKAFIEAYSFYEDITLVRETEASGYTYIDKQGEPITDKTFYRAKQFYNGVGIVGNEDGKWAIIDEDGEYQTDYIYNDIDYFYNDLAEVDVIYDEYDSDGYLIHERGLINKKGKTVLEPNKKYTNILPLSDEYYFLDMTYYRFDRDKAPSSSLITDKDGNVLFKEFEEKRPLITYLDDDLFVYHSKITEEYKIIDKNGDLVFDLIGKSLIDYHNGYFIVKEQNPAWEGEN